jgi:hypothetical protein
LIVTCCAPESTLTCAPSTGSHSMSNGARMRACSRGLCHERLCSGRFFWCCCLLVRKVWEVLYEKQNFGPPRACSPLSLAISNGCRLPDNVRVSGSRVTCQMNFLLDCALLSRVLGAVILGTHSVAPTCRPNLPASIRLHATADVLRKWRSTLPGKRKQVLCS